MAVPPKVSRFSVRNVLVVGVGGALLFAAGLAVLLRPAPEVVIEAPALTPIVDVVGFVNEKARQSAAEGVPEWSHERLVLHRASGSEVAILYLHGFSATRGEGEMVVDALAQEWSANVYYPRLPGHGGSGDEMGTVTASSYFAVVAEALALVDQLGEKTVIIGTSTGGALAIWAAAMYPDKVDAVLLASPLVDFGDPTGAVLLGSQSGEMMARMVLGEVVDHTNEPDPSGRRGPMYSRHWNQRYPSRSLVTLEQVRRATARPEVQGRVTAPVLLWMYYEDDEHKDEVVSRDAALAAFSRFNGGSPHPLSRRVDISDGSHVLLSEHVRTDKDSIMKSARDFLRDVVGLPPRERALRDAGDASP